MESHTRDSESKSEFRGPWAINSGFPRHIFCSSPEFRLWLAMTYIHSDLGVWGGGWGGWTQGVNSDVSPYYGPCQRRYGTVQYIRVVLLFQYEMWVWLSCARTGGQREAWWGRGWRGKVDARIKCRKVGWTFWHRFRITSSKWGQWGQWGRLIKLKHTYLVDVFSYVVIIK